LEGGWDVFRFAAGTPLGLLLGLAFLGIAYVGAFVWSDTLIFTQTELHRRSIPFPFLDRKSIRFDQILKVRHSMRGVLVIEMAQRDVMLIRLGGYEGGWAKLVQELGGRIGEGRLTQETRDQLWDLTNTDRWSIGLSVIAVLLFLMSFGWSYFQDRGRAGIAWSVGARKGFGSEIVDFTVGGDGELWVLERRGVLLNQSESYQLVQYLDPKGEQKIWKLPSLANLLPSQSNRYTYPSQVLIDDRGKPWINFRFLDQVLYLDGDQWEWLRIPSSVSQGYINEFVASAGAFWGDQHEQLIVVEPSELAVWRVPGFSDEPKPDLEIFETPTGGLVMAHFSSGKVFVGHLTLVPEGLEWIEVSSRNGAEPLEPGWTMATTNIWGVPYVIHWTTNECSDGEVIAQIGRYTSRESGWAWDELDINHDCGSPLEVDGFIVDTQERIWISTREGLRIYGDLAFLESGVEPATEKVRYTESNSGYFHGNLRQDVRGRVWSLDESGKFLVWQDGGSDYLPKPLPEFLATFLGSQWVPLILQYLGIFTILGIFFVVWEVNRFKGRTT
jgi:hypothetical protein